MSSRISTGRFSVKSVALTKRKEGKRIWLRPWTWELTLWVSEGPRQGGLDNGGKMDHTELTLWCKVPVWAVLDYTETRCLERELLLVKVSILGSEYVEEQLAGGPSLAPR